MHDVFQHYTNHISTQQLRCETILAAHSLDGLVIDAGSPIGVFMDDMHYPFKVNPFFKQWLPLTEHPHCLLLLQANRKPTLLFYQPVDFWHKVAPVPTAAWSEAFDIQPYACRSELPALCQRAGEWAYIGSDLERAASLGVTQVNPSQVINALLFNRSIKTAYEIDCLAAANHLAVAGHRAAQQAFLAGESELAIHQAYLAAIGQTENQLPYGNIIALNQNGAILHYTQLESQKPATSLSFLIDAGAQVNGYAADITRTYSATDTSLFAQVLAALDGHQQALLATIKPGMAFLALHQEMHQRIAQLLVQFNVAEGTPQQLIQLGITKAFFPHGLGHPLGLQVHDAAGYMQAADGTEVLPPAGTTLRCTRILEVGMVLTIEPGFYVIDSLLTALSPEAQACLNTAVIDKLRPYGGIRIEDNIVILPEGIRNLTRECHLP